ncbi:preprotein translocase subunit YajC [Actinomycetospora chlora]|uniref:Preprotein translocase subunit YajC n=1 Tax=Actinomycetospora chlora TaxID=663608 RepID=A0ABP9AC07_9PSEU
MDLIFPLLILLMIGLVFFSSRQRKKQEAQQQSLQNALNVGDVVVMTSGISGTVVDVDDERTIDVEIAPDVVTTWLRAAVREKLVGEENVVEPEEIEDADVVPQSSVPTESTPVVDAGTNGSGTAKADIAADNADTSSDSAARRTS